MANDKNLKPFKAGVSGNPNGRPKGQNRNTVARKWLALELKEKNPLTGLEEILSAEDIITLTQIKKAKNDEDSQAYKVIMDSAYGAPKQEIDMTSEGERINPTINIINSIGGKLAGSEKEVKQD